MDTVHKFAAAFREIVSNVLALSAFVFAGLAAWSLLVGARDMATLCAGCIGVAVAAWQFLTWMEREHEAILRKHRAQAAAQRAPQRRGPMPAPKPARPVSTPVGALASA